MQKRACALVVALLVGLAFSAFAHAAAPTGKERILSMDVEMSIHERGWVSVSERIVFEAAGREIKRGIVRELPKYWTRPDGKRGPVSYHAVKVRRDGAPEPKHFAESRDLLEIYIGRQDFALEPGIHEYIIEYDVVGAILRKDNVDNLYWNATGNGWIFPIENASFRLRLPGSPLAGLDGRVIERDYFTGKLGELGKDAKVLPDGAIASTKALGPGEGVTVFYSWPTEITSAVKVVEFRGGLVYSLLPSLKSIYVFAPTLLLLLFYALFARRWGWGRKKFQIIPIFDPPAGLSPGVLRYVVKGRYDYQAFAADMLALVDKKYLFLVDLKDPAGADISVISRYPVPGDEQSLAGPSPDEPRSGEDFPPGGSDFYERLFPSGFDAVELDSKKPHSGSRVVGELRLGSGISLSDTYSHLAAEQRKKHKGMFRPVRAMLGVGLFFWFFLMAIALGVFKDSNAATGFVSMLVLPCVPLFVLGVPLLILLKRTAPGSLRAKLRYYGLALLYMAFGLVFMFNANIWRLTVVLFREFFGIGSIWEAYAPAGTLLSIILAAGGFVLCWFFLPRRSEAGQRLLAQAEGVEMYLKTAEEHRFEALYSPDEKVRHFESLLPYALALDVGETWANSFAEYCKKAGLADVAQREISHMQRSMGASRSIGSSVGRSSPQSSGGSSGRSASSRGGGGGGSSGGGAGGGGGRGW